jgi:AraC-like DNA-binding protein
MAKKIEELEQEIARLEKENERLDLENVRLLARNLQMSEQLNSWYELRQRVGWLKAEMQRGRRLSMQADLVDDAELLAMLESRLEQEPQLVTADFSAKELAELMGVSQARLMRLFRNSTIFRSADEYLENLRLVRALRLLRDHPQYGIAAVSAEKTPAQVPDAAMAQATASTSSTLAPARSTRARGRPRSHRR